MKYFILRRRRRLVPRRASAREMEMGRRVAPPHALAGEGVNERQIELPSHPSLTSARDGEEGGITEREGDRRRTEHGNEARCGCQSRAVQVQDDLVGAVLFRVAICTFERRDGLPHPSPFNSFPPPFPSSFSTPGETANQSPLFVVLVVGEVVVWTVAIGRSVGRSVACTTE